MQRLTFLKVPVWTGVPIPPLEVEVDPMVGPVVRSFIAEPLHDPVPAAEPTSAEEPAGQVSVPVETPAKGRAR